MVLGLDMRFLGGKRGKINCGEATAIESVEWGAASLWHSNAFRRHEHRSGFQPLGIQGVVTQGGALG